MKKLFLLLLSICSLFTVYGYQVSKSDALRFAMNQFDRQDVDFYLVKNVMDDCWVIFIDADPMKGWEHDCYLMLVGKEVPDLNTYKPSLFKRTSPVLGEYEDLWVKNRYSPINNQQPMVPMANLDREEMDVASHTYAVIISGGINPLSNHERYWNDCSFLYKTLRYRYGIAKSQIIPIMADGIDPGADMHCTLGGYMSQNLDLDGDGLDDIELSASRSNINSVLRALSSRLQKDDHLFVYVIDHGGRTTNGNNSYICLWNGEILYDYELAELLTPFSEKLVNINVVLGQCNSGGFVEHLAQNGVVVSAACEADKSSYACQGIPYDEFVYHWTCAINGRDHLGSPVDADLDNNGRVTMKEAFVYAQVKDKRFEVPQYASTPVSIGLDLSFNYVPASIDLYVKDDPDDEGAEPNVTTELFWKSPSIWVRNEDDGIEEHENPIYSRTHPYAFIYVRVYNRGKEDYVRGKYLQVYWAQASTGFNTKAWKGRELYTDPDTDNQYVTGGPLESIPIGPIPAGSYRDIKVNWTLPRLLEYYPDDRFHFCLMARIMDTSYDDGYVPGTKYFDMKEFNDQSQRNITIVKEPEFSKDFCVYLRNVSESSAAYSLELQPHSNKDKEIFNNGQIHLTMSPAIQEAWARGGCQSDNVTVVTNGTESSNIQKVRFCAPGSRMDQIQLVPNQFDILKMNFKMSKFITFAYSYEIDLIQRDEQGNIIGGETFVVTAPKKEIIKDPIFPTYIGNGEYELAISGIEPESVYWYDSEDNEIGAADTVIVAPTNANSRYTALMTMDNGEVLQSYVELNSLMEIEDVKINKADNTLQIELASPFRDDSDFRLVNIADGSELRFEILDREGGKVLLGLDSKASGDYILSYLVGGKTYDQKKLRL